QMAERVAGVGDDGDERARVLEDRADEIARFGIVVHDEHVQADERIGGKAITTSHARASVSGARRKRSRRDARRLCNPFPTMTADSVTVNGRRYRRPTRPLVVVCVDGCEPSYLDDAIAAGVMP